MPARTTIPHDTLAWRHDSRATREQRRHDVQLWKKEAGQFQPATGGIFRGTVSANRMVGEQQSKQVTAGLVSFAAGGRNVFHTHTFDQLLFITEGEGIVATEQEEIVVRAGDLVMIPAGEKHWHGATPTTAMTHLTIGAPGTTQAAE
jgi:quercetin dioxygenase-like cupin family protein